MATIPQKTLLGAKRELVGVTAQDHAGQSWCSLSNGNKLL